MASFNSPSQNTTNAEQETQDTVSSSKLTTESNEANLAPCSPQEEITTASNKFFKGVVQNSCHKDKAPTGQFHGSGKSRRILPLIPNQYKQSEQSSKEEGEKGQKQTEEAQSTSENVPEVPNTVADICASFEGNSFPLSKCVNKIREALSIATKYSHCFSCLQKKKSHAADLLCLDCSLSFCSRCSSQHKSSPSNNGHILVPVAERCDAELQLQGLPCSKHHGADLGMYCRNCEMLLCRECTIDQHLDCPGKVSMHEYASEEREAIKRYRVRHAQVMRFFAEQRQDTEEALASLIKTKRNIQDEIHHFFSALMKASMDCEAALLEELEFSVSNNTDLLTEQSAAWQILQESTKQLLDVTDVLHLLPDADFLPQVLPCKSALSQALEEVNKLAVSSPPEMTLALSLSQSAQRSVVKRIKEIGAMALTVNTHKTISLRKLVSVSFSAPGDKGEPLVTAITLLTQTLLIAADFNNACLKLFRKEEDGESWGVVEILPLKWRPYGIASLSDKHSVSKESITQEEKPIEKQQGPPEMKISSEARSMHATPVCDPADRTSHLEQQSAMMLDDTVDMPDDARGLIKHIVVSSPFAGCFLIAVPLSSHTKMKVVRAIAEGKGYWGLTFIDEHRLAVSTTVSGRSYVSIVDTVDKALKGKVFLASKTTLTPLMTPRHIMATSPTSVLVADQGRKAIIHISIEGEILNTLSGHGSQRFIHPEGLTMDGQGHVYIADSGDSRIFVLTKHGHLYSTTGSQLGELSCPLTVHVDKNSHLFVSNDGGKLLTVFDIIV